MLLTNCIIGSGTTLSFKSLNTAPKSGTESTGVFDQFVQLGGIPLGGSIVHIVERPRMQIANLRDIVVVGPQIIFDR
jgi:hypothetical protein